MNRNSNNKSNWDTKQVSTKPTNIPKNINKNGKNNMRLTKTDKK